MIGRTIVLFNSLLLCSWFITVSIAQRPDCPEFGVKNGKVVKLTAAATQITCDDYFLAKGNLAPVCVQFPDGYKWNTYPAKCIPNFCAHTEEFVKGNRKVTVPGVLSNKYPHVLRGGAALTFICEEGSKLDTPASTVTCVVDLPSETSRFTSRIPECISMCEELKRDNGEVVLTGNGVTATLKCGSYYTLKGHPVATCVLREREHVWDLPLGECLKNYCKHTESLNEGNRIIKTPATFNPKYPHVLRGGERVHFGCKQGYKLDDPIDSVSCLTYPGRGAARFDKRIPECV